MASSETILSYERDARKPLDDARERTFHDGWDDAVAGHLYDDSRLHKLSWQNLGNRLGRLFGDVPEEMREELLFWAERQRRARS